MQVQMQEESISLEPGWQERVQFKIGFAGVYAAKSLRDYQQLGLGDAVVQTPSSVAWIPAISQLEVEHSDCQHHASVFLLVRPTCV